MDQIKLLVKDVLYKIQDIPDVPFNSVRMSDIASGSSLSMNASEKSMFTSNVTTNMDVENNNEVIEISKMTSISHDIERLYITDKGSHDSIHSLGSQSPSAASMGSKPTHPRIIMGKRALMRSKSGDMGRDPADVVHELVNVNEKYQDKVSHYISKIYHRRMSRESRSTDDDGTGSNYSGGSLRTPDSLYDGKSYFSLYFPQKSETDFDFLHSTDDLNKDTTAELFNSTLNSVDEHDISTDSEYDPNKFLKNAVGDFDGRSMDITSIKKGRLQHSRSVDPINSPSIFSKAGSIYSSMRKSIKRACSFREKTAEEVVAKTKGRNRDRCQSYSPDCNGSTENLMRQLYIQNGIIFQVSKALTYCRSAKDVRSPEYVEAEKILLVASCHKDAIQAVLDSNEFGEEGSPCSSCSGTLEISNLIFYLREDTSSEEGKPISKDLDEFFVIVIRSGRTVVASKVLTPNNIGEIVSDRKFEITGLHTDFDVSIAVYSMKVKTHNKQHGSDSKIHKKDRKVPCPSTKNFFNLNSNKSSRRNLLVDNISSIKPSSFTLLGSCIIRCSDLEKKHFRLTNVPVCSCLEAYFTASLTGQVVLTKRSSGFMTLGIEDKSHLTWNRRWCVLDGTILKYWNYPSEEFACNPVGVIDLSRALEMVSQADRSICPRPRTLYLLIKNRDEGIVKYFLSADNQTEKQSWQDNINHVFGTLEAWKCLYKEKVSSI